MKPLVSVLILTFNQEAYIEQALRGALMQQCSFPFEILVVDDHSSDATADVCRRVQAEHPERIRLVVNPANKGVVDNYFDSLLLCEGDYIADCAGDDFWTDPLKLQRQADILQRHPDVSLAFTDYAHYDQATDTFLHHRQRDHTGGQGGRISYASFVYDLLNQHDVPFLFLGTACYRKEAFVRAYRAHTDYFRSKDYTCEDFQLCFFLLREGDFYQELAETTAYRMIADTVSRTVDPQRLYRYTRGVFLLRTRIVQEFGFDANRCREALNSLAVPMLSLTNRLGLTDDRREVWRILRSLRLRPSWRVCLHGLLGLCPAVGRWLSDRTLR